MNEGAGKTPNLARLAVEFLLSLSGSVLIALLVPWEAVLSDSIPSGGDIPAHPVLMKGIYQSLFFHGQFIHYSFDFWGGFEQFQFYFPLPYAFAAALSLFAEPNLVFKLSFVVPLLLLPPAFYFMARLIGLRTATASMGSLLAVSFIYTEAHNMWGANIFSALAGMVANAYGMVFFVLGLGFLLRARKTRQFSPLASVFIVFSIASHFYAFLMLALAHVIFVAEDLFKLIRRQSSVRQVFPFYLSSALGASMMLWWMIPLIYYKGFSTDFGMNWEVNLLETFRLSELVIFGLSICVCALLYSSPRFAKLPLRFSATTSEKGLVRFFLLFLILFLSLFFGNELLHSTAFVNVRLWPSIYLVCFLLLLLAIDLLQSRTRGLIRVLVLSLPLFLAPSDLAFERSKSWFFWNAAGVNNKPGYSEFRDVVEILNQQPYSRISFESNGVDDWSFGSVRAFEILPYVTQHEVLTGGIVNSATFPGISYTVQCLTSDTCAGWPHGLLVPEKDFPRAIDMMRALGTSYHLATRPENFDAWAELEETEELYRGKFVALYRLKPRSGFVEVYDRPLPILQFKRPHIALLALPRFDGIRRSAVVFDSGLAPIPDNAKDLGPRVNNRELFNELVNRWDSEARARDRAVGDRSREVARYLNNFLFSLKDKFSLVRELEEGPDFFIADRGFDPSLLYPNLQQGYSEAAVPLTRTKPGRARLRLNGVGYTIWNAEEEYKLGEEIELEFKNGEGKEQKLLVLKPKEDETWRHVDVRSEDPYLVSGISPVDASDKLGWPEIISDQCKASVEQTYHQLILKTSCPGKPHLVKYNYYPKWKAEVSIYLASNGFMALTPRNEITIISHQNGLIDKIAITLSVISFFAFLVLVFGFTRVSSEKV